MKGELVSELLPILALNWVRAFSLLMTIGIFRQFVRSAICGVLALGMAILASLSFVGHQSTSILIGPLAGIVLIESLICQVILGCLIALPWAMALELFALVGRLCDSLRGAQFAEIVLPMVEQRQSLLENAGTIFAAIVLLPFGAYQLVLEKYFEVEAVPNTATLLSYVDGFFNRVLELVSSLFDYGLSMIGPVLCLCILIDFAVVLLSRSVSRGSLHFEFFPLKMLFSLLVMVVAVEGMSGRLDSFISSVTQIALQ